MDTPTDPAAELAGLIVGLAVRLAIWTVRLGWWAFRRPWWALVVWILAPVVLPPRLAAGWWTVRFPVAEVLVTLCLVEVLVPRAARAVQRMVQRRRTRRQAETAGRRVVSAVSDPQETAVGTLPRGLRPTARRRLDAWKARRDRRRLAADLKAAEAAGVDAVAVAEFAAAAGATPLPPSPQPARPPSVPMPAPAPVSPPVSTAVREGS